MPEFFDVISVNKLIENLDKWLVNINPKEEVIPMENSLERVLFNPVYSKEDIPGFFRSTVDGFSVIAKDTFGASESLPAVLKISGDIKMGEEAKFNISPGECVKISTGGMLPNGSDSVVMVEDTEYLDEETINIFKPASPLENVIKKGEDIKKDEILLDKSHKLRPQDLGALAGVGKTDVSVAEKPKVFIISTGNEIVHPSQDINLGQIRDINSYTIASLTEEFGGLPIRHGIVEDNYESLESAVKEGISKGDMVIVSGGSSVGTMDETYKVLNNLGKPGILVHGMSIKPGKPTIFSMINNKPVIGLPGHPVSAMIVYRLLGKRIIYKYLGKSMEMKIITARLTRNLPSASGRDDFIRVKLEKSENEFTATPILGKSGLISTMVKADGLIRIESKKEGLKENEKVEVELF